MGTFRLKAGSVTANTGTFGTWSDQISAADADLIKCVNNEDAGSQLLNDMTAGPDTAALLRFGIDTTEIILDEGTIDEQTLTFAGLPAGFTPTAATLTIELVEFTPSTGQFFLQFDALTEGPALDPPLTPVSAIYELEYDFTPPFEPSMLDIVNNGFGLRVAVPGGQQTQTYIAHYPGFTSRLFGIAGTYEIESSMFYNAILDQYDDTDGGADWEPVANPAPRITAVTAPLPEINLVTPVRHLVATVNNAVLGSTGAIITIWGSGFVNDATVTVNGDPATSVIVVNSHKITCLAPVYSDEYDESVDFVDDDGEFLGVPASFPGEVEVTNPDAQEGSIANGVIYFKASESLSFTGVSPNSGSSAGGTRVTIFGGGFEPVTEVRFGGVLATELEIVSEFEMTCVTPEHAAGVVNITITV